MTEPRDSQPNCVQPVINYCLKNVATPQIRAMLRNSGYQVVEDFCLQRCGQCFAGPFVVIDGAEVVGDSHQAIIDALPEKVASLALRQETERNF
jgi:uncharacterized protein YuzB (UPF0349 family)